MNSVDATHARQLEPQWTWAHLWPRTQSSPPRWLLDEASLTDRLVKASAGNFHVVRLSQCWLRPRPSERQLLDMPPRQLGLVREVQLMCNGIPWVYARSVIPASTCTGQLRHLRVLGNKSLGSLLFRHPDLERSPFQLALVSGDCAALPTSLQHPGDSWARRSRFKLHGKKIMVSETFLPAFTPWSY